MKKVLSIIAVAVMVTMVSCGPSAEEKAKIDAEAKRVLDSAAAAATAALEPAVEAAPADSAAPAAPAAEAPAH